MKTNNVDVGKDALNLFVVAGSRFMHKDEEDDTLRNNACFVTLDKAIDFARVCHKDSLFSYTVYKLEPVYTASNH